jgi:heterotetrameric sarcosine oxidase gamma subunit
VSELTLTNVSHELKWRTFVEPARGHLAWSVTPGEWTAIGSKPEGDVVDLTSVRAMFRLTGAQSADLLNKVCALNLSDDVFSNGSSGRTLVASVATELVRDDQDEAVSYLILPSRSFGRYMEETLRDAGLEFGLG